MKRMGKGRKGKHAGKGAVNTTMENVMGAMRGSKGRKHGRKKSR